MSTMKMPLYYGDNGVHEFWESTNHEVMIFRNHGKKWWMMFVNFTLPTEFRWKKLELKLLSAIDEASLLVGKELTLDYTHRWMRPENGQGDMILMKTGWR